MPPENMPHVFLTLSGGKLFPEVCQKRVEYHFDTSHESELSLSDKHRLDWLAPSCQDEAFQLLITCFNKNGCHLSRLYSLKNSIR